MVVKWLILWWCGIFLSLFGETRADYQVGVGRSDCTGPAAEITFMGYAKMTQKGCGIHLRQYSRAFVFQDTDTKIWSAFVSVDACMMNNGVKDAVMQKLGNSSKITKENLILSGTHTHGAPGGFLMDVMLDIPNLGFCKETFDALTNGIARSIQKAVANLKDAEIYFGRTRIKQGNINRSPASYLCNPEAEKLKYEDMGDTDKDLVQIKFIDKSTKKVFGAINWFAVHPTSMNNSNCLITSDNVGYASILLEKQMDQESLPGKSKFVGAFASTNLGDVSPNIKGPRCINTGEKCDTVKSTCDGQNKYCIAFGPGKDMFESTKIIAHRMFDAAKDLLSANSTKVEGKIQFIHQFVSMPDQTVNAQLSNGTKVVGKGCRPAMGYGFAAGTTDGPGEFDFHQATNTSNPFWNIVRDFIFPPSPEDVKCHAPKPILIMSGSIKLPYEWQPEVVATQIVKIGQIVLAAVPGEFTTMSGRRLREQLAKTIKNIGNETVEVIVVGLSNTYTNYIATREEYQLQRYEGASTIFGPYTLEIYLKQYTDLAQALMKGKEVDPGPEPYKFPDNLLNLITPVIFDTAGWYNNFGDCIKQPPKTVKIGDVVSVKFISGHPRNNLKQEDTFLKVEKKDTNNTWITVANDASWETRFIWTRIDGIRGSSQVEIIWETDASTKDGTYRISHYGNYKYILGGIFPYKGQTREFEVTN